MTELRWIGISWSFSIRLIFWRGVEWRSGGWGWGGAGSLPIVTTNGHKQDRDVAGMSNLQPQSHQKWILISCQHIDSRRINNLSAIWISNFSCGSILCEIRKTYRSPRLTSHVFAETWATTRSPCWGTAPSMAWLPWKSCEYLKSGPLRCFVLPRALMAVIAGAVSLHSCKKYKMGTWQVLGDHFQGGDLPCRGFANGSHLSALVLDLSCHSKCLKTYNI